MFYDFSLHAWQLYLNYVRINQSMKKLFIFNLVLLFSFTLGSQVAAQTPTPRGLQIRQDKLDQRQERQEEQRTDLCQRVTDRQEQWRQRYFEAKEKHASVHQGVISRLRNLITKLDDRGCDTGELADNVNQFEALVQELADLFNAFIAALHDVTLPVCQDTPQDHRTAMAAVREKLQQVKNQRREIHNFYQTTLKPDLKRLAQACRTETEWNLNWLLLPWPLLF